MNKDSLQRFIIENTEIRGEIVHLNKSLKTILAQHHYPAPIRKLLAEALVATALLTATIKFEGQLTLQFKSDGPIKLLVTKSDEKLHVRGLVQYQTDAPLSELEQGFSHGQLLVTVQQENPITNYQSVIPLQKNSIAKSLENYFAQSEQLPTRLWLAAEQDDAAGILLQLLPNPLVLNKESFWQHAEKLDAVITEQKLLQTEPADLLRQAFPEHDIRIFHPREISFRCTCSPKRMENAVLMLGEKEAFHVLKDKQEIVVTCEFCNNSYAFDKTEVSRIFEEDTRKKH